jgi:hypothetical protein
MTTLSLTPRQISERDCWGWIRENYRQDIVQCLSKCSDNEFPMIVIHSMMELEGSDKLVFSTRTIDEIKMMNDESLSQSGCAIFSSHTYSAIENIQKSYKHAPVLVKWMYSEAFIDNCEEFILREPLEYIGVIARPFQWAPEPVKPVQSKPKTVKPLEKDLESDLLKWLHMRGVHADNQIKTSKHRMDLWIPGKCFLELKTGKVSGDDVCQAIDYCAEYKLPVILVGNHIGEMASRGIEAFNKAVDGDLITFVQWSAVKTYLKGMLIADQ